MKARQLVLVFPLILILTALNIACDSQAQDKPPDNVYKIIRVVDGDTIILDNKERVRLIGVDTLEKYPSAKLNRDAERTHTDKELIKAMGRKASDFTKNLSEGKIVRLEYDQTKRDIYGRLLAYVYLPDGRLLNEEIILQGYGFAYLKYPFKPELMSRFREAETKARDEKRGLWGEEQTPR